MPEQLHKFFQDVQLRGSLDSCLNKSVKLPHLLQALKVGRSRFFALLKAYRQAPANFSIVYKRRPAT